MVSRQAVVLIHGIGEQMPMDTLRGFVDAVWNDHTEIHHKFATQNAGTLVWSKPDTVSDGFELRRLTTPQNKAEIRTDFFEFYWQHLMQGTTYGHVFGWASTLLRHKPLNVPPQLRASYWLLWGLAGIGLILILYGAAASKIDTPPIPPWLSAILAVLLVPLAGAVVKGTIGDAARYLHPAPANVQCRNAIRAAGIKVLKALHDRNEYDRIILVGHSLGSVIGYDILTHTWPEYNRDAPTEPRAPLASLEALEMLARSGGVSPSQFRQAQRHYFDEMVENGSRWRVTDFVTLGSPLAHAEVMLARHRDDLHDKQVARELPTSPPRLEESARKGVPPRFTYPKDPKHDDGFRIPHHAAVFGPARWTNLYFPNRRIVYGDLIGGPLRELFGNGVCDLPVDTTQRGGWLAHTLYWRYTSSTTPPPHIVMLRSALDLCDEGTMLPPPAQMPSLRETAAGLAGN